MRTRSFLRASALTTYSLISEGCESSSSPIIMMPLSLTLPVNLPECKRSCQPGYELLHSCVTLDKTLPLSGLQVTHGSDLYHSISKILSASSILQFYKFTLTPQLSFNRCIFMLSSSNPPHCNFPHF